MYRILLCSYISLITSVFTATAYADCSNLTEYSYSICIGVTEVIRPSYKERCWSMASRGMSGYSYSVCIGLSEAFYPADKDNACWNMASRGHSGESEVICRGIVEAIRPAYSDRCWDMSSRGFPTGSYDVCIGLSQAMNKQSCGELGGLAYAYCVGFKKAYE